MLPAGAGLVPNSMSSAMQSLQKWQTRLGSYQAMHSSTQKQCCLYCMQEVVGSVSKAMPKARSVPPSDLQQAPCRLQACPFCHSLARGHLVLVCCCPQHLCGLLLQLLPQLGRLPGCPAMLSLHLPDLLG